MDKQTLLRLTADFAVGSPTNRLSPPVCSEEEIAARLEEMSRNNDMTNQFIGGPEAATRLNVGKTPAYVGMTFFQAPILAVGSARDEGFQKLKEPGVVGPHHMLPQDWLPGAKTVISLFFPYSERVLQSNTVSPAEPSMEWVFTRVDGQQHLLSTAALVAGALEAEGWKAVVPQIDGRFRLRASALQADMDMPAFSSNWSERHVAYLSGLGTFGRSTNLITQRGCGGRLISIVTDWDVEPDAKDYKGLYDYCAECGACFRACPAAAFPAGSKALPTCAAYVQKLGAKFAPRYGCGKCQSGLPCTTRSFRNPHAS